MLVMYASHSYFDGDSAVRKIIEDKTFYEQVWFHWMCYLYSCLFCIIYNRRSDPRVLRGRYGILAPIPDRLVDMFMTMGLKVLFRSSGCDLGSVVCALMLIFAIDFDRIRRETDITDVYLYY